MRLEHKATGEGAGLLGSDDDAGVVEALVSVTGVVDSDGDVIEPGVYADTLKRRKPKGIFGHDWQRWASRTEQIEEWLPGDPRLPKVTRDGTPWPKEAGGLYVKTRYNLATQAGRESYENVKFYGPECEWSIGYRVPKGKAVRGADGVRRIKGIDLFEYSPVLFGANNLSGTLSLKSIGAGEPGEVDGDDTDYEPVDDKQPPTPEPAPETPGGEPDAGEGDSEDAEPETPDGSELSDEEMAEAVAEVEEWAAPADDDADEDDEPEPDEESKGSRASLNRSPRKNWVENSGELPGYVREVARSIHEKRGMPLAQAIPIAIATMKRWCRGGGDVNADTKAKACKAVAEWEALKGKNRARSAARDAAKTAEPDVDTIRFPFFPGTYEELRDVLREQTVKSLEGTGAAHVEILGTWPQRAVVAAYAADGKAATYEIPYTTDADEVTVGEPEPVELKVTLDGEETDGDTLLPYPAILDEVTNEVKALLAEGGEDKAGRVLSGINAKRLLAAVEQLVAVLEAAGLHVGGTGGDEPENEAEPQVDSTAPSVAGKAVLDPGLLARGYRLLGEVRG